MPKTLREAIEVYSKNEGVRLVEDPKPGQRVIVLQPSESGYYVPCCATITQIGPMFAHLLMWTTGDRKAKTSRTNLWTAENPEPYSWLAPSDQPYIVPSLSGDRKSWIGTVYVQRQAYSRAYPEIDYDEGELTRARVVEDWLTNPASFTPE